MILIPEPLRKFIDIVGNILAFLTVLLIGVMYINTRFPFIGGDVLATMTVVREYMILATIIVNGFAFASKHNFVICIIFVIFALIMLGFSFPAIFGF